jgi:hypothetical protein
MTYPKQKGQALNGWCRMSDPQTKTKPKNRQISPVRQDKI